MRKPSPSVVRIAKYGDELAMFDTILLGHADNGLWPLSESKILKLVEDAVKTEMPERGVKPTIGIIGDNGAIEAMTCFTFEQYWYTDEWHIAELFNWVHPDYRASKHAEALMAFQRKFTDDMSAVSGYKMAMITGVMSLKRLEAKMNLFGRKYPQIGAIFAYNLDVPSDAFNQRHVVASC
jgi:hypothetical protein